jgi:uncharacterized transporter YbjL
MRRVFLILGLILLLGGISGAVASTAAMGGAAAITSQALRQLLVVEVVSTIVAMIGLVITILAIVLRRHA